MNRSMHGAGGRPRLGSSDFGGARDFGEGFRRPKGPGGPGLMDAGMMGAGGYGGGGGGGYEMDGLVQQRSLQQQLSLRESQLALANNLLQRQQHQSYMMEGPSLGMGGPGALGPGPMGMMMSKRRQDMRQEDFGPDFKRPRNDFTTRSRDRYRDQDSDGGNKSSSYRRNQSSSSGRSTPGKSKSSFSKYDPATPTTDDEKDKSKDPYYCHVCNVNCRDGDGFQRHMNSIRHNDLMMGLLAVHDKKSVQIASRMKTEKNIRHVEVEEKSTRGFCKICDTPLKTRYAEHQSMTFHKKRVKQVTKGCGWCSVSSFKNFTEVLAHRETEEHQKNQKEKDKDDSKSETRSSGRDSRRSSAKKRAPIRVEIPADLARFDSDVTYGQVCVMAVTGWFCKLCNKFYNNESAAKDAHCKTEEHYVKYKRFVYAKLKAKAEAERDAQEKAEEEEEEKKKDGEEESEQNGKEEEEKDEEVMEEGGAVEEEEDAMLAADGSAADFVNEDAMQAVDGSLLEDTKDASEYHTADNTIEADNSADREDYEGEEEISAISLASGQGDDSTMMDESQDGEEEVASNATRNASTPLATRGNKARRGRKGAK